MKYVVDASVALKWVLPEPESDKARDLRDGFRDRLHDLVAPSVLPVELAHALTRAERKGILPVGYAKGFLADILLTSPVLHPYLPLLATATDISSQTRQGVYDSLYVALAQRERCDLVTADMRLFGALHRQFPFLVPLSALP